MLSTAYELEPMDGVEEQDLFLSILYHDARGGNAIRLLIGKKDNNQQYVNHFANKNFRNIEYLSSKHNAYASINTFKSYRRKADEVYNMSCIFIDLDGHDFKTKAQLDKAVEKTKARLRKAFKSGEITPPTMMTFTGRGMGVFYNLTTSIANTTKTEKSIKYMEQVKVALTAKYKKILSGKGLLEVDTKVKDNARVCRMPQTMNHNCNEWCRLIHVSRNDEGEVLYYDLKELAFKNHLFEDLEEVRKRIQSKKVVSIDAYKLPFLTMRMQKLETLQALRNNVCAGCREYMTFIYYNAAKQVFGEEEGREATEQFNNCFVEPLPYSELEHAFSVTEKNMAPSGDYNGFYKLSDSWIIDALKVTKEENSKCLFGSSRRQIKRREIKEANKSRRAERNREIAEYIKENPGLTYASIATLFEVSESMIYRICKQYDIRRYKTEESAEEPKSLENTANIQNLQKVAESLLGVPSGASSEEHDKSSLAFLTRMLSMYDALYGEITSQRREKKQIKGQYGFKFNDTGGIDYYMIS